MRAALLGLLVASLHIRSDGKPTLRAESLGEPTRNADAGEMFLGTLWCGQGHLAWHHNVVQGKEVPGTNAKSFHELSDLVPLVDSCCRMHDYCPAYAKAGDPKAWCASEKKHIEDWNALRDLTLSLDLVHPSWSEVQATLTEEGPLPPWIKYETCGEIEEIGGSDLPFGLDCECDRALLTCLTRAAEIPGETTAANFIRETYFHTALNVPGIRSIFTTNVDRHCLEREEDGHFVRDVRTDRDHCVCTGGCGAGAGEDRAWCYTGSWSGAGDKCGEHGYWGQWDYCDKFCYGSDCAGYDKKFVYDTQQYYSATVL